MTPVLFGTAWILLVVTCWTAIHHEEVKDETSQF